MTVERHGTFGTIMHGQLELQTMNSTLDRLHEDGYAVVENVLSSEQVDQLRDTVDRLFEQERQAPFEPDDGPPLEGDDAIEAFLAAGYTASAEELSRIMQRIRRSRARDHATPWPVPADQVLKNFLHMPTLFDDDRSQRIWQILFKAPEVAELIEHPAVLPLVRHVLGEDCVLSDCSATSIGPQTGGGAWHVDVPLGQLPEPLPDFPLTTQNVWLLDDFTEDNGATQLVPGSHHTRRKPKWDEELKGDADPISITAPAGSVAMWLSNTWHRSGPNLTDRPRRAILCYYGRSWVKPFTDYRTDMTPALARRFTPTARYLLGCGAAAPVRR